MALSYYLGGEEIASDSYAVDSLPTREQVRELSEETGGQFFLTADCLTHVQGSWVRRWILRDKIAEQAENQARLQKALKTEMPLTYGGQARAIIKWLGWQYKYTAVEREIMSRVIGPFHFQHCLPKKQIAWIRMYDLKSAYWQMVGRMPSPLVRIGPNGSVSFYPIRDREKSKRWNVLYSIMAECPKPFRLIFVGACASGIQRHTYQTYCKGQEITPPLQTVTPLAGMATLAIRATYEVTQEQARRLRSRYANADCCTVEGEQPFYCPLEVWGGLGLDYDIRAEGEGEIRAIGYYRIGDRVTDNWPCIPSEDWYQVHTGKIVPPVYHTTFLSSSK